MERQLSDYEWEHHTLKCYCDKCGTQLRIHPLYPRVGGDMLTHACIRKPPHMRNDLFRIDGPIELKPYDMPKTLLFEMDYKYKALDPPKEESFIEWLRRHRSELP